jgi:hypothetical protein
MTVAWKTLKPWTMPAVVFLASALIAYVSLDRVRQAQDLHLRTEALTERADQTEARLSALDGQRTSAYALCDTSVAEAEAALGGRLTLASESAGFAWSSLDTSHDRLGDLERVRFTASADTRYELIVQALQSLSQTAPTIFVEALELRQSSRGVSVDLRGSILCSTAQR